MSHVAKLKGRSRYLVYRYRAYELRCQHQPLNNLGINISSHPMAEAPTKRRRPSSDDSDDSQGIEDGKHMQHTERVAFSSLSHPISPPRTKRARLGTHICSPFRLTSIDGLPDNYNIGAVSLKDLIGDPLIAELWDFNYLHDIDFLMGHLDVDTRALTDVHVVHGFWKREDPNREILRVSSPPAVDIGLCSHLLRDAMD